MSRTAAGMALIALVSTAGEGSRVAAVEAGRTPGSRLYSPWPAGFLYVHDGRLQDLRVDLDELPPAWSETPSLDAVQDDVEQAST